MRYGILSDVHGNLEALEAVLALYQEERIENFFCCGDVVGYGANPKECLEIVRGLRMLCIAGNHDWAVSGRLNPAYFNPVAKEAIYWTQKQLTAEEIGFLNDLQLVDKNDQLILTHGSLNEPESFHYMMYLSHAVETFRLMDRNLCFIGHSHVPQIIIRQKEKIWLSDTLKITMEPGCQYIINVGSVGQPRDGNPMAGYCVYDTKSQGIEIKRITYDIKLAQKKILQAGLPASLAARLSIGH
ncbi:MAG: metallophosphoesterase family protein [Candidatus Omnitrophica bacterium]|nr:metallophosphoesterase family protein [Candidatus Omnitrophota bacterium]